VGLIRDLPSVQELIRRFMMEFEQQAQHIHSLTQKEE